MPSAGCWAAAETLQHFLKGVTSGCPGPSLRWEIRAGLIGTVPLCNCLSRRHSEGRKFVTSFGAVFMGGPSSCPRRLVSSQCGHRIHPPSSVSIPQNSPGVQGRMAQWVFCLLLPPVAEDTAKLIHQETEKSLCHIPKPVVGSVIPFVPGVTARPVPLQSPTRGPEGGGSVPTLVGSVCFQLTVLAVQAPGGLYDVSS